jgi:hypothetical protein
VENAFGPVNRNGGQRVDRRWGISASIGVYIWIGELLCTVICI